METPQALATAPAEARTSQSRRPQDLKWCLYVLRTGCRWEDVPREYGSHSTCWRRLKAWEEDGTWELIWRSLLTLLDDQGQIEWTKAFLDGSFVPAKKGELVSARPSVARAPR